jgi:hypothetical protein
MGLGIIDGVADSIGAMRKVLITARSVPALIHPPQNALGTVVNAAVVSSVLLFINRSMVSPLLGANNSASAWLIALNALVAVTSFVPIFIFSIVAVFVCRDNDAENAADRWLIVLSFIWTMSITISILATIRPWLSGTAGNSGSYLVSNYLFGHLSLGFLVIDIGLFATCFVYGILAFLILAIRTWVVTKSERKTISTRSYCVGHILCLLFAALPSSFLLYLTLWARCDTFSAC